MCGIAHVEDVDPGATVEQVGAEELGRVVEGALVAGAVGEALDLETTGGAAGTVGPEAADPYGVAVHSLGVPVSGVVLRGDLALEPGLGVGSRAARQLWRGDQRRLGHGRGHRHVHAEQGRARGDEHQHADDGTVVRTHGATTYRR